MNGSAAKVARLFGVTVAPQGEGTDIDRPRLIETSASSRISGVFFGALRVTDARAGRRGALNLRVRLAVSATKRIKNLFTRW